MFWYKDPNSNGFIQMFAERLEIKAYNANTFMRDNEFVGFDNLSKFLIKRAKKVESKVNNARLDAFIDMYGEEMRETDLIIILDERHTQKQISKLTFLTDYKQSLPLC